MEVLPENGRDEWIVTSVRHALTPPGSVKESRRGQGQSSPVKVDFEV